MWDADLFEADSIPATAAVWINLRLAGRIVGTGQTDMTDPEGLVSLPDIRDALQEAMAEATIVLRGDGDPVDRADREAAIPELPIALELQVAQTPQRIREATLGQALSRIVPGTSGLIVRIRDEYHLAFPGEMLSNNQDLRDAVFAIMVKADVGLQAFEAGLADGFTRLWAFDVLHLTQRSPSEAPAFRVRGSSVVRESAVDMTQLKEVARAAARHLLRHSWIKDGQLQGAMLGPYLAEIDQFEPLLAEKQDQALAALALLRFDNAGYAADSDMSIQLRTTAITWLAAFGSEAGIQPALSPGEAAITLLAIRELRDSDLSDPETTLRLRALGGWCLGATRNWLDRVDPGAQNVSRAHRAAMAAAIGSVGAMINVWNETPETERTSLLPWLGWTFALQQDPASKVDQSEPELTWLTEMSALRASLCRAQIQMRDVSPFTEDLIGGIKTGGSGLSADWHSLRPLTFLAMTSARPALSDATDPIEEILRLTRGGRFVAQLAVRPEDGYRLANPETALGGMRSAPWEVAMPPAATAMGLLAVTETLDAVKRASAKGR